MNLEYPIHESVFVRKTAKSYLDPNFYIVTFNGDPIIDEYLTQCVLTHNREEKLLKLVKLSRKELRKMAKTKSKLNNFGLEDMWCNRKEIMKACLLLDNEEDMNIRKLSTWELIFLIMLFEP